MTANFEPLSCDLKVVDTLEKWVNGESENGPCRHCLLAPLAGQYAGALIEAGDEKHQRELEIAWDSGDVLTVAQRLDKIKEEVGEDLKRYLRSLDCMAQSFQE